MQVLPKVNTLRKGSLLYRSIRYRKGSGIYSSSAFSLITEVIKEKCSHYSFYDIEFLCKQLLFWEGEITCPGRQNKGKRKTRSIGGIVEREPIRPKHGALLFHLTNYFKPKNTLQIGTMIGSPTLYLTSYATRLRCTALEDIPKFATITRQAFAKEGRSSVDLRIGNYRDLFSQTLNDINNLDFVFFNTLYEQHDNLRLFNERMRCAHNDTVFVFEGTKASHKIRELWEEICACPKVTITLDLYSLGIILLNRKLHKRDYIVYFQDLEQVRYEEEYYLYQNRR